MKKSLHLYVLCAILFIGILLRFWQFGAIPQGFQVDEAAFGYNAYSLLKTGKDEYGTPYPVILRSYDDQKAALYSYIDIPFIAIMGLNPTSVRMPAAILGVLFILLAYAISLELTKSKKMSLIVALLCAISPTLIFQNRIQSDPTLGVFLVASGSYLFLRWIKSKRWLWLLGGSIVWGLSLIAYQSPRAFLLLFLPFLFWHFRAELRKNMKIAISVVYVLLVVSVISLTISGGARLNQTSIFTTPEVTLLLEESIREEGQLSPTITRIFDNKPIFYGRALADNYFSYLSFDFLFLQTTFPFRESLMHTGFLYLVELPFLLIGIYQIIKRKLRWGYLVLGWTFLTPLVLAPFSTESPNIHRFLLAILPLELLVAFGIIEYFDLIKKRVIAFKVSIVIVPVFFATSLLFFLNQLFVHQPVHRPWQRSYPFEQLITDLKKHESKYSKIVVTNSLGNTYMFYLFYNQYDPATYHQSGSKGNEKNSKLGKYEFASIDCPLSTKPNVLYVINGMTCPMTPKDYKLVQVINWGDNTPAFKLYEYISK